MVPNGKHIGVMRRERERERGERGAYTSEYKEEEDHNECIAKVEEVGEGTSDGCLVDEVVD